MSAEEFVQLCSHPTDPTVFESELMRSTSVVHFVGGQRDTRTSLCPAPTPSTVFALCSVVLTRLLHD